MRFTNAIVFGVATCIVLAGSTVVGRQHSGELSGIRGVPVEGHDIVAGIEIMGTTHIDSSEGSASAFDQTGRSCGWGCRLKVKRSAASRRSFET